ncbi:hypothetical protein DL767_007964 [Monosporascus sp. MG133]|nr:hypothetical protein DL767_007964 [Monosporascus sp. MG133]
MPLVNLQQPQNLRGTASDLLAQHPRLIYGFTFAVLGLLSFFALSFARGRRRKGHPESLPISVVSTAINQQRLWLSEKSRGVSNHYAAMAANHPLERSTGKIKVDGNLYLAHDGPSENQPGDAYQNDGVKGDGVPLGWHVDGNVPWKSKSRPPPPPPLTPPTLTGGSFPFEDRRLSDAVSAMGDLDMSFIHQPNPDYTSPSDSSTSAGDTKQTTPATPRRKSYTKIIPIGSPHAATDGELEHATSPFSPSSFPSSSPILPLAPHASFEPKEIDVKGEIISLTDDSGAGWKRHTRVYGGGVCLACMASGGHHGGFYGQNVRPEERR